MRNNYESLSIKDGKKLVLLSQKLPPIKYTGSVESSTQFIIEHLGYIQIDTISVIQRAHHHTLWNRNPLYKLSHMDKLIKEKKVFEYWSHAASYLPMKDYSYSLIRKKAFLNDEQKHWYNKNTSLMKLILKRIENEGPLKARDFEHRGKKNKIWSSSKEKQALESLFMQGELMISSRQNFQKVYDLTQNVIPKNIDISMPTLNEYARFLIIKYLNANAFATIEEISYLQKNIKEQLSITLKEMYLNKELKQINIKDKTYYILPDTLNLLNKTLPKNKCKILSPFDNMLIQRKRLKELFEFDYKLECYTPKEKRKYGYFVLPILWDGKIVARMDCKADKKESILFIYNIVLEKNFLKIESFAYSFYKELLQFCKFNNCNSFHMEKTNSIELKNIIDKISKQEL